MADNPGSIVGNPPAGAPAPGAAPAATPAIEWGTGVDQYNELLSVKGWKTGGDILKSYAHLEKAIGADKVVMPKKDEDLLAWEGWQKLGVPDKPEGYEFAAPEGFQGYDPELANWFRQTALESKLPPKQAQRLHDKFVEKQMEAMKAQAEGRQAAVAKWNEKTQAMFGQAFSENVELAQRAAKAYLDEELAGILRQTGLESHPGIIKAFADLGRATMADPKMRDSTSARSFKVTPDEAKAEIAALRKNPALYNKADPEYAVINAKLTRLYEAAYPDQDKA